MTDKRQYAAMATLNRQVDAIRLCDELAQERTIARNPAYATAIARIRAKIVQANVNACLAYFPRDTLGDLPPAA